MAIAHSLSHKIGWVGAHFNRALGSCCLCRTSVCVAYKEMNAFLYKQLSYFIILLSIRALREKDPKMICINNFKFTLPLNRMKNRLRGHFEISSFRPSP